MHARRLKHLNLLLIHAPETQVEKHRRGEQNAREARIQDDEMGIFSERGERHGEEGANAGHGDGEGIDDGAHALGGLVVRVFRPRGQAEHLGHAADGVDGDLEEHGDVVREAAVVRGGAVERFVVAGGCVVD